jgi:transposase-like protein
MGKGIMGNVGTFLIMYNLPYWFYKFQKKHPIKKDLSPIAKNRLSAIEFYYQIKDVSLVCRLYHASRKTFYKWLRLYEKSGKKLQSLEDLPKTPIVKRSKSLDLKTELEIKHLREKYIKLGKVKHKMLFEKEYGRYISQHHISFVIQKYNLFLDPQKAKKIRLKKEKGKGGKKIRINEVNPKDYLKKDKPFFFCLD